MNILSKELMKRNRAALKIGLMQPPGNTPAREANRRVSAPPFTNTTKQTFIFALHFDQKYFSIASQKQMPATNIQFKQNTPIPQLSHFVESFWMIKNHSDAGHEIVILPDGRFDIIFSYSPNEPYNVMQMGLGDHSDKNFIPPKIVMFAVSFKLLAIEYLLDMKAASLLNGAHSLPADFWGITKNDLDDFENFCKKVSAKMFTLIKPGIDSRKQKLFELIYSSKGSLPVKELSEKVFWSSRQINRYFNEHFGVSLKAYCNILRFKESLPHIKEGKLYPEQNFADQAHFIREVKKLSGVIPKELFKNQNDRFILLSALPKK